MKKRNLLIVLGVIISIFLIAGATYAFFVSSVNSGNITTKANNFGVDFEPGDPIVGPLELTNSKEGGLVTEVNIKMAHGSALAKANIFVNIEKITANLAIESFKWEVVGKKNNVVTYTNNGSFLGYNDTTNNILNIVEGYLLTEENTTFTVYFWLDGNSIKDTSILNSEFKGYIGAKTDNFTAALK